MADAAATQVESVPVDAGELLQKQAGLNSAGSGRIRHLRRSARHVHPCGTRKGTASHKLYHLTQNSALRWLPWQRCMLRKTTMMRKPHSFSQKWTKSSRA